MTADEIARKLTELYGKPRITVACQRGEHEPGNAGIIDHDKRLRKVFGVLNLRICKHCHKLL